MFTFCVTWPWRLVPLASVLLASACVPASADSRLVADGSVDGGLDDDGAMDSGLLPDAGPADAGSSDAGSWSKPVFHSGDFGTLLISPDKRTVLVRRIEPGDEWIVDEFGRLTRPRLLRVDSAGALHLVTSAADIRVWFSSTGGFFYVEHRDRSLVYVDSTGASMKVSDRFLGLSFDDSNRVATVSTTGPREYKVFDTETKQLFERPGLIPWGVSGNAGCVVGYQEMNLVLVRPRSGGREHVLVTGVPERGARALLTPSCRHLVYYASNLFKIFDLDAGSSQEVNGVVELRQWFAAPGGQWIYFTDRAGIRRIELATGRPQVVLANAEGVTLSPAKTHLLASTDPQGPVGSGACYRLAMINLVSGGVTTTTRHMCPEVVGYAVFSGGGGTLRWSDGPFNAMASPVATGRDIEYCKALHCAQPGEVSSDNRWIAVPETEDPANHRPSQMSLFNLENPGLGRRRIHTSSVPYDRHWSDLVRFTADDSQIIFGVEEIPHNPDLEGPCPAELRATSVVAPTGMSRVIADSVVGAEIGEGDRLFFIVGAPRLAAACRQWSEPAAFSPGLHVQPFAK